MSRILVAEDDADIASLVRHYLEKAGYTVDVTDSGRDVLPRLRRTPVDAVILDLMLPGMDGLDVCRAMRADPTTGRCPSSCSPPRPRRRIASSASSWAPTTTSPSPSVRARSWRACGRSCAGRIGRFPATGMLTYGPLTVDVDRHVVKVEGQDVRLTAKEFLLLRPFLLHRGRVLSRDLLLSDVWDYAYTGGTRTVDVHVRRLREKLPFLTEALVTVKQFGYKLLDPAPAPAAEPRPARR